MSNRPVKKKKVVEITQEDFEVEWTPPSRTGRDRFIQFGVLFLIICFLLPTVVCAFPGENVPEAGQQPVQQTDEVESAIKNYSEQLSRKPNDPNVLANLAYYMTQKAERILPKEGEENIERLTVLANAEKYFRDALAQDPEYGFAQLELARNLMVQEKPEEANELVVKALAKADENLGSEDEAVVNKAKNQKVELLKLSAVADLRAGNQEKALEKLTEMITLKPGEASLYLGRGEIYWKSENKDAARKDFELAVDIGQKTGDQRAVAVGQAMIEAMDNPQPIPELSPEIKPEPTATP